MPDSDPSALVRAILNQLASHSGTRERQAVQRMRRLGDPVFPALVGALKQHPNANARSVAARALAYFGPKSRPALYRALSDRAMTVRLYALSGVDRNWTPEAASRVVKLLKDPSGGVRVNAIAVLGKHRVTSVSRSLTHALNDNEEYVRHAAREALAQIEGTSKVSTRR